MTTQVELTVEAKKPPTNDRGNGKPAARSKRKRKHTPPLVAPGRQAGSPEAKKTAAAVLEVLGGERRPTEAAEVLGISVMRYYILESRALEGLVAGCEPRPRGRRSDPEKECTKLSRRVDTLERDLARYQALSRASHRALGITPVKNTGKTKRGRRKRRRPSVRALKAAGAFRASAQAESTAQPQPAGDAS